MDLTLVKGEKLFRSCLTQLHVYLGKDRASRQDVKFIFAVRLFRALFRGRNGCAGPGPGHERVEAQPCPCADK